MFNYVATFHTPVMMMIMIIYSPIMMIMCSKIVHHRLVAMVIKSKVFSFLVFYKLFSFYHPFDFDQTSYYIIFSPTQWFSESGRLFSIFLSSFLFVFRGEHHALFALRSHVNTSMSLKVCILPKPISYPNQKFASLLYYLDTGLLQGSFFSSPKSFLHVHLLCHAA